jgi:single-stranded DNA-specific DHH superfamily exonuclease
MSTSDTVLLVDEDTDGMCATRIMHNALTTTYPKSAHSIHWQNWDTFGLKDGDIQAIIDKKPRTAYILDIGSGLDMLKGAEELLKNNINVVILDNHPPDVEVENGEDYTSYLDLLVGLRGDYPFPPVDAYPHPYFFYKSTTESCTTAIVYDYCRNLGMPVVNMEKWALLGLTGDVATNSKEGGVLYKDILSRHPHLRGLLSSTNIGGFYDWSILDFYARYLHVPRRMIFNEAPPHCYASMKELEQIPDWLFLYNAVNKNKIDSDILDHKNPETKFVLDLQLLWQKEHSKVEERGNITTLDFPDFAVSVVNHKWNLGSALASKLSGQKKKSWFVINDIPDKDIHVSGRGGKDGKLHIGKVFRRCDPAIMKGGGLRPAGSAKAFTTNVEAVLDELVRAVEASKQ